MEKIVSISLGSPSRDFTVEVDLLGRRLAVQRRGVGGSYHDYFRALAEADADPEVRAIGLGGINRYLLTNANKHEFSMARKMVATVRTKPVVDGCGLKTSLEPYLVHRLQEEGVVDFSRSRVLMVAATDRWGMARALRETARETVFGDLMFGLDLPIPLGWNVLCPLAALLVPVITRCVPFKWLYPTGETKVKPKYGNWYAWADVVAGDWKFIQRCLPVGPEALRGKTILTNTVTSKDVELLRSRGAALLVTTTPNLSGRSFGTNVIEAVVITLAGKRPEEMTPQEYLDVLRALGWDRPRVEHLNG
ncbi:MAG TPA: quinate 5-dehydrogenase [Armatimonadota bacterium]|nr:quinate 5-dehydrogenase [Armatimonadota bacterium]HPT98525.1 quinate 5-dehydrogenase [Armatimonadota bacterium]